VSKESLKNPDSGDEDALWSRKERKKKVYKQERLGKCIAQRGGRAGAEVESCGAKSINEWGKVAQEGKT